MTTDPFRLSSRLGRVAPSITMAVTAKAAKLRSQGVDIISYGAGEPDFDTPEHIKEAARRGLVEGVAKYTTVQGLPSLREAIAAEMKATHGRELDIEQIIVTCGAKQALFNLFLATLDEGDEVIIPAPYWVSYPDMVKLAGGEPVIVETLAADGFTPDPKRVEAAITSRTRAIVLNTPSNPTGAIYTREALKAIGELAVARDLFLVSDDIYRSLVYPGAEYTSVASISDEIAERTVLVDGVSKTYAMTGWRIGYAAGPHALIKAMAKIQGQSTSGASHIAQVAAREAIAGDQACVAQMREAFDERRREMVALLRAIPGVECTEPKGAFYAFPDVSAFVGKTTRGGARIDDDVKLAEFLIEEAQVALVPGSGFGAPGFVRLSYACSMDDIRTGLARMKDALATLH
jgi:aspartate aminotransferase